MIVYLYSLIHNVFLFTGTVFLIVKYDWSAWWMLLPILFCTAVKVSKKEEE